MLDQDPRLAWLRAYIAKAKQGYPYAPNVKSALLDMLDSGETVQAVCSATGCTQKTLHTFMDARRRAAADLRRAERGKAEDKALRDKALADRDARLRLMPQSSIEIDLLGSPPPGRSALDLKLAQLAADASFE